MEHKIIDIQKIKADTNQPRKTFDQEELKQLAKSIITHGLLQSIIVREEGQSYIIVAGERRYRACKLAGLKGINCHVIEKGQHEEIALIENMQRVNLEPLEEAIALKNLMELKGYTQEYLGRILGKNSSYISLKLKLLTLDDNMQKALKDKIQEGHARAILSLRSNVQQKRLYDEIIENNLNVKEAEKRAKSISEALKLKKKVPKLEKNVLKLDKKVPKLDKKMPKQNKGISDKYLDKAVEELEETLGTRVKLSQGKTGGSLNIEYYSQEDLESLIDRLLNS